MKTIKIFLAILIAAASLQSLNAQSNKSDRTGPIKTIAIKVSGGDCDMDKKRIEKAAYTVNGVKSANWNEDSKVLTIKYDLFKKDAPIEVQKSVALAGHDTELYRASDSSFHKLPECCNYTRKTIAN